MQKDLAANQQECAKLNKVLVLDVTERLPVVAAADVLLSSCISLSSPARTSPAAKQTKCCLERYAHVDVGMFTSLFECSAFRHART